MSEVYKYTWDQFEDDIRLVNITLAQSRHDLLVGVAAGGLPLLVKLKNIWKEDYGIVQCRRYTDRKQGDLVVESLPSKDIVGKKLVLLDDVADHGTTLAVIKQKLVELGAAEVRIFTLFYKPRSIVVPEYYVRTVANDVWISFPWEDQSI